MHMYTKLKFANSNDFAFPLASAYRVSTANISNIRYLEQILISFGVRESGVELFCE